MTTTTPTIADFLADRIAEEERYFTEVLNALDVGLIKYKSPTEQTVNVALATRVLAESEAHRLIVKRCDAVEVGFPSYHLAQGVLRALALPYADHPDYNEAWRP